MGLPQNGPKPKRSALRTMLPKMPSGAPRASLPSTFFVIKSGICSLSPEGGVIWNALYCFLKLCYKAQEVDVILGKQFTEKRQVSPDIAYEKIHFMIKAFPCS